MKKSGPGQWPRKYKIQDKEARVESHESGYKG